MEDYLSHHGILGQKWGVRRYQNPDGTLTSAGKKRYSESEARKSEKPSYNVSAKQVKKNMAHMTDSELQKAINRLNMQQQVDKMNPGYMDKGRKMIRRYRDDAALIVGTLTISAGLISALKKAGWV